MNDLELTDQGRFELTQQILGLVAQTQKSREYVLTSTDIDDVIDQQVDEEQYNAALMIVAMLVNSAIKMKRDDLN